NEITNKRVLTLRHEDGRYEIDGKEFDPDRIDQVVKLGAVEEWQLKGIRDAHPFHMHVNSFEVLLPTKDHAKEQWVWRDTVMVGDGESVTIRARFTDFCGKTVLHCHNLDHEDKGMMQTLYIVPNEEAEKDIERQRQSQRVGFKQLLARAPTW